MIYESNNDEIKCKFTKITASLVAIEIISAQETRPWHFASKASLIASMSSYPLTLEFGTAVFSLMNPSNRIDASQPYVHIAKILLNDK